jgi:hypothetical protein
MSLISDNSEKNSYAYVELRGTTHEEADQDTSQSVGSTVKFYNRSVKTPWVVGFHSEAQHGVFGPADPKHLPIHAKGVSIGFNCEVIRKTEHGTVIGLNIQNTNRSIAFGDSAIKIQSTVGALRPVGEFGHYNCGWDNGILFEGAGLSAGKVGINFGNSEYETGIDLGDNSIRLNEGQKIFLERSGQVWIEYNASTEHVELHKGPGFVKNLDD